ncbi:MAG: hypothetical protein P8X66_08895, partial [Maritimibacter sp.]
IEAAIVDGAGPFQVFFKIKVPQISGTIVVVWTTITLVVLKIFDIVFAMTNGQWQTQVLANYMFDKLFRSNNWGVGSASAMVIMLLVLPIPMTSGSKTVGVMWSQAICSNRAVRP